MPDCLRASVDNGPFLVFLEPESEPEHRNRRFKPSTYILTGEQGEQYVLCTWRERFILASKHKNFPIYSEF